MAAFQNYSIRHKLMGISLLASIGALLLAGTAFMTYDYLDYRSSLVRRLSSLEEIISLNTASAVVFNDSTSAAKTLASLKARSSIMDAGIYTPAGKIFAAFHRDPTSTAEFPPLPPGEKEVYHFDRSSVIMFHPMVLDQSVIGTVYLKSDLSELATRLQRYMAIGAGVLIISMGVAGFISFQVGRKISEPLLHLVRVARDVSEKKDYSVRAVGDSQDELGLLIRTFNDMLTKIQEDGEALRKSEQRFRAFVMASSDVVYRMSPDWSEMRQLQGRDFLADTQEPSRAWFQDYIPLDDQPHVMAAIQEAIRTKSVFQREHRVKQADGTVGWTFSRAIPLLDAQGKIVEWFGTASDVTKRKQAEAEIHRLNSELEQKVVERTAQLTAANKELESFSYSVSHDLRAPLRHISGFSDLLQKNAENRLDQTDRRYLNTIVESARHMGRLIDDLLAFSRMGRAELSKSTLNLNRLIEEVRNDLKMDNEDRDIVWDIGPLPEVRGDPSLMRQVLFNLISNALKYSRNRPQIRIKIGCQSEGGSEAVFFIRDNGVGFEMKYIDKLFGVFQRLHSSDEFEGTGIGLANVRRIIQRHGGRTWAEGVVDQGATFYFSLPKNERTSYE